MDDLTPHVTDVVTILAKDEAFTGRQGVVLTVLPGRDEIHVKIDEDGKPFAGEVWMFKRTELRVEY